MATAVAKRKAKTEVAVMEPNMFAADAGVGVNDLGSEDLAIPFIKVLQKMSDELDDLENAKAGDIYNTVTKEVVKVAMVFVLLTVPTTFNILSGSREARALEHPITFTRRATRFRRRSAGRQQGLRCGWEWALS